MKYSAFAMAAVIFAALSGAVRAETLESVKLAPVDYTFIGLTSLGNQFQIDSGKLGETHARSAAVRNYAKLMDTSHVQVQDNLMARLRRMNVHRRRPSFWQVRTRA
jgi:predicted outer membrane protein